MRAVKLQALIESLTDDIEFQYKGTWGAICPFSHTNISVSYGDTEKTFDSVDATMNTPFIDGKPMKDICEKFII